MKRLVKRGIIGILIVLATGLIACLLLHKKRPEGLVGPETDVFAKKILTAINHDKYLETDHLQWSFRNEHHYIWHKNSKKVLVQWNEYEVHLDLDNPEANSIVQKPSDLPKNKRSQIIATAIKYFNNDSFWVVAPHKLLDPGTTRKLVALENNEKALLVTYSSGGTTPGDAYLWRVDNDYTPVSYQMWVSIIPIGGLQASWESWQTMESGAKLAKKHKLLGMEIPIDNLRAWND